MRKQPKAHSLYLLHKKFVTLCIFLLAACFVAGIADAQTAFMPNYLTGVVYSLDLSKSSVPTQFSLSNAPTFIEDIAVSGQTAYLAGNDGNIYSLDLSKRSNPVLFSLSPLPSPSEADSITISGQTAYVGGKDLNVYSFDLTKRSNPVLISSSTTSSYIFGMGISGKTLYLSDDAGKVYALDLANTPSPIIQIATTPGNVPLDGISISGRTAYMGGYGDGNAYSLDLSHPTTTKIISNAPAPPGQLNEIVLDGQIAYLPGDDGIVYALDLTKLPGNLIPVSLPFASPLSFTGIVLFTQINTLGLCGNNLNLGNYLNSNAPQSTITLFANQSSADYLKHALEMAAPTRNTIGTFSAQTTQVSMAQPLSDHLCQNRWLCSSSQNRELNCAQSEPDKTHPSSIKKSLPSKKPLCRNGATYTPWLGLFGDFAHEAAQHQTPAFSTSCGGVIAAFDYNGVVYPQPLGTGIAYAHTYIHEKNGFGHINVDQGTAVLYGTFNAKKWYFDLEVWGGYYHLHNIRKMNFPGFEGTAESKTHGWQLTPHLEIGYDYLGMTKQRGWFGIEPFAMADWVCSWEHSLRESGTDGVLDYGQKGKWCSLLRSETGLRFDEMLQWRWGTLMIREKAGYVYQKASHTGSITAFLIGSSGSFNVKTLIGAQNMGVGELEFFFTPCCKKYPQCSIAYQGEFGSKYQSNQVIATIAMDF